MIICNSKTTKKRLKSAIYPGLLIILVLVGIDDLYAQDRMTGFKSQVDNISTLVNQSVKHKGIESSESAKDTSNYLPKMNVAAGISLGGGFISYTLGKTFSAQYVFRNRMVITSQYHKIQENLNTDNYRKGKAAALLFGYHFGKKIIQASTSAGISYYDFQHYGYGFSHGTHSNIGLALNAKLALTYEWVGIGLQGTVTYPRKIFLILSYL